MCTYEVTIWSSIPGPVGKMNFRILLWDPERKCPLIFSIHDVAKKSNVPDVVLMTNPLRLAHIGNNSKYAIFERKIKRKKNNIGLEY